MARPVRGVLCVENSQTGDGRVMADGSITWQEPPFPLAWLQNEQHGDLLDGAVQIGTVDTITRTGSTVAFTGMIDDGQPDGAEMVRRMDGGTASHGNRQGLSVDPDNWAVQVISTMPMDDMPMMILASVQGDGPLPTLRTLRAAVGVRAAAGDPDPGDGSADGTELLFEDNCDGMIARFTRLRLRGVTACAIPAFTEAYMELDDAAASEPVPAPAPVVAAARPVPPRDWFYEPEPDDDDERMVEQYDPAGNYLGLACPLTITDDGQVYGHLAASWSQRHVGYPDSCVGPPPSASDYSRFHVGLPVETPDGPVNVGPLVVGCDHPAARLLAPEARDFYAHNGLHWANVRASDGRNAPWVCGALVPGLSSESVRLLQGTSLSGDWRAIDGHLELIVGLSVSGPGFPVAREALAASGLGQLAAAAQAPTVFVDAGERRTLIAARPVSRCPDCERRRLAAAAGEPWTEALGLLRQLDLRTRHLIAAAADHRLASIRPVVINPDPVTYRPPLRRVE